MKKAIIQIALFFKRLSFIYRGIGIFLSFFVVFWEAIPDLKFNIYSSKPVEVSISELLKTSPENIPRYLKIKDAVVPSGSYVEYRKEKNNSLVGIYYPVYPHESVKINLDSVSQLKSDNSKIIADSTGNIAIYKNTDNIEANLVIYDTHVLDNDLDSTGTYFNSPTFSIEGQYSGEKLTNETLNLFTSSGLHINANAIVLKRGDKGFSNGAAIGLILLGIFLLITLTLSFVPTQNLIGE